MRKIVVSSLVKKPSIFSKERVQTIGLYAIDNSGLLMRKIVVTSWVKKPSIFSKERVQIKGL